MIADRYRSIVNLLGGPSLIMAVIDRFIIIIILISIRIIIISTVVFIIAVTYRLNSLFGPRAV